MFDMGFTEMMLIGIVALVVIGPERLPGVARTAGKYFSRLRNFMMNVRADVESELKADELREMFEAQQKELQSLKEVVSDAGKDIGLEDIQNEMSDIASSIDDAKPTSDPEPKAKPATKAKSAVKVAAKSQTRAKPGARPKAATKLKPKAKPKTKNGVKTRPKSKVGSAGKAKIESNWTGAIVPPATGTDKAKVARTVKVPKTRAKTAKPAKVQAK